LSYVTRYVPPEARKAKAAGGVEERLTEAGVMLAIASHLLDQAREATVWIHPDGEHAKRFDIPAFLAGAGFEKVESKGSTAYGGTYRRGSETVIVDPRSGRGDVVGSLDGRKVVVECKGGTINSTHAGQLSRLRRGLCEAVGLLMTRPSDGAREIAAVPFAQETERLARRMADRCLEAGIEIALVRRDGAIVWIGTEKTDAEELVPLA
jgi:hypothetical protein